MGALQYKGKVNEIGRNKIYHYTSDTYITIVLCIRVYTSAEYIMLDRKQKN